MAAVAKVKKPSGKKQTLTTGVLTWSASAPSRPGVCDVRGCPPGGPCAAEAGPGVIAMPSGVLKLDAVGPADAVREMIYKSLSEVFYEYFEHGSLYTGLWVWLVNSGFQGKIPKYDYDDGGVSTPELKHDLAASEAVRAC